MALPHTKTAYDGGVQRLRLGELLVQAKLISEEQLRDALALQQGQLAPDLAGELSDEQEPPRLTQPGRKLGQVLIDLGVVNETQLTQALGQQLSIPWVSLSHIDFSRQLLNLVPREVVELFCLIPIFVRRVRKQGDTLYVAMDDPTHEVALEAVRISSGMPVRPMIAAPSDIRSAISAYYGGEDADIEAVSSTLQPQGPPRPKPPPPLRVRPAAPAPPPRASPPPRQTAEVLAVNVGDPQRDPAPADSPDASPVIEARMVELPQRRGAPGMVALTLLDGSTLQLPRKARRRREKGEEGDERGVGERSPESLRLPADMTARDLLKALRAVSEGADARAVFGDQVRLEAICASLLSALLRKGLVTDLELAEELRRK